MIYEANIQLPSTLWYFYQRNLGFKSHSPYQKNKESFYVPTTTTTTTTPKKKKERERGDPLYRVLA